MSKPRILFLTIGGLHWASSRLRSHWPAEIMENADVAIWHEAADRIPLDYDVYIWMKVADPQTMKIVNYNGGVNIIELCDPMWWFEPVQQRELFDLCDVLVAATEAAKDDVLAWYGNHRPCYVVPDRLNLEHYTAQRRHINTDSPRFIWYGMHVNRVALYAAMAYLDRLEKAGHKFSLTIYDDKPGSKFILSDKYPTYQGEWRLEQEVQVLNQHDIALLPPYPGPWGPLKTNNKELTAWACGLPVTDGQDYEELRRLVTDWEYRQRVANDNYERLLDGWTTEHTAAQWDEIIDEIYRGRS